MEATMDLMGYELDFPLFGQILYGGLNPAMPMEPNISSVCRR